jgi:hypothetical protein
MLIDGRAIEQRKPRDLEVLRFHFRQALGHIAFE